jgi:hypothetical protein
MAWHPVANVADIKPGDVIAVEAEGDEPARGRSAAGRGPVMEDEHVASLQARGEHGVRQPAVRQRVDPRGMHRQVAAQPRLPCHDVHREPANDAMRQDEVEAAGPA